MMKTEHQNKRSIWVIGEKETSLFDQTSLDFGQLQLVDYEPEKLYPAIKAQKPTVIIFDIRNCTNKKTQQRISMIDWINKKYPKTKTVLLQSHPNQTMENKGRADECLYFAEKGSNNALLELVLSALTKDHSSHLADLIKNLESYLPASGNPVKLSARDLFISKDKGIVEGLHAKCKTDNSMFKFVAYRLREHKPNLFTVAAAAAIGCGKKCLFCLSGKIPYKRPLSFAEIIGQTILGLQSMLATSLATNQRVEACVNFTGQGDLLLDNFSEGMRAIEILAQNSIKVLVTSLGHAGNLRRYLNEFRHTEISMYWSFNFADPNIRKELMPAVKKQDTKKLIQLYREFAIARNDKVTINIILIHGLNDTEEEAQRIYELFGRGGNEKYFKIKVQNLIGTTLCNKNVGQFLSQLPLVLKNLSDRLGGDVKKKNADLLIPSQTDLERFGIYMKSLELDYRLREVIGQQTLGSCGSTIAERRRYVRSAAPI